MTIKYYDFKTMSSLIKLKTNKYPSEQGFKFY